MDSETRPVDSDRKVTLELKMSGLRDEMDILGRRMSSAIGGGLAMTALFLVGGTFMDKSSTLWFLGIMWLLLTLRLVFVHRASGGELRLKEAELQSLASPSQDAPLPPGP
ncbi:MAG: hypothetical protein HKN72_08495 [Gemmatimonadetes bacterium]|nr:hypothetical protein [Gemmatimonadota bacterium]